jgi:hypothetical protein
LRRNTNFYGGKVEDNPNFIGIRDRLFNGGLGELFAGFFNEEKIENKEAQELEKVKELALTKGSNQGEVKKFISKTGKELVKIKEEIEQREKN